MTITEQRTAGTKKKHVRPAPTLPFLLRYTDLVNQGIVSSWMQLNRLIDDQGFPTGMLLSANTRAWPAGEVEAWLASRPTAKKPVPRRRARTDVEIETGERTRAAREDLADTDERGGRTAADR